MGVWQSGNEARHLHMGVWQSGNEARSLPHAGHSSLCKLINAGGKWKWSGPVTVYECWSTTLPIWFNYQHANSLCLYTT